jgi:hypothetical protein
MPDPASLTRLGGGRWQSRDGRFTIEPQSGTWVVVDGERTDELGLPLVRGPFPTLTAAKADIEATRDEGEASSPLADRIAASRSKTKRPASGARVAPKAVERAASEPAWLRSLDGPARERARTLLTRLVAEGVDDAETLVRSDLVGGQPALARLAIARAIGTAATKGDAPDEVAHRVADVLLEGGDRDLGVAWRLVDGDGRPVRRLDRG